MIITIPVAGDIAASGFWNARFPSIDFGEECLDIDGRLKTDVVARRLAQYGKMFRDGSTDDYNTYSMTVEFVRRMVHTTKMLEDDKSSSTHLASDDTKEDRRLVKRMTKGETANVRIVIRDRANDVCFAVNTSNPKKTVIGQADVAARSFAVYCLRIIYTIAEDVMRRSGQVKGFRLTMKSDDPDLVADAIREEMHGRACDRVRWLNERHARCACCRAGFCSPPHVRCRFNVGGMCKDIPFPDKSSFDVSEQLKSVMP